LGVGGDTEFSLTLPSPGGRGICCSQHKDRFTFGEYLFGVGATKAGTIFGKIIHPAVMSMRKPLLKCGVMRRWVGCGNAAEGKPQLRCLVFDGLFYILIHDLVMMKNVPQVRDSACGTMNVHVALVIER